MCRFFIPYNIPIFIVVKDFDKIPQEAVVFKYTGCNAPDKTLVTAIPNVPPVYDISTKLLRPIRMQSESYFTWKRIKL